MSELAPPIPVPNVSCNWLLTSISLHSIYIVEKSCVASMGTGLLHHVSASIKLSCNLHVSMHYTAFVPYSVTAGCSLTSQHSRSTAYALLSDHD